VGTRAVWAGEREYTLTGATQVPVVHSVAFGFQDMETWLQVAQGKAPGHIYGRNSNPTVQVFEEKLRSLEGAEAATSAATGMAAISATLFTLLMPGERVGSVRDTYGGTSVIFGEFLPRFKIDVTLCDTSDHDRIEAEVAGGCRVLYLESPTNPTTKVLDIARLAAAAHARGATVVVEAVLRRSKVDSTTVSFVNTLLKFGLFTVGVVTALDTAGVETSAVLASLGVAGLTIGFAARDALSNIISGILIFLDRPFTIGDLVEVQGAYGRVEKITLRSTRVVTPDGKMLAIPNTAVINNTVASYTNVPHLRLDIPVTVGVAEDLGRVRNILLGLVADNPASLTEPAPRVHVTQLNDYNVAVELRAWLENEREHVEKRAELREFAFNALNRAGVAMPFETIQLAPFEARLGRRGDVSTAA
jgi:small conductance mechanosensitive channel